MAKCSGLKTFKPPRILPHVADSSTFSALPPLAKMAPASAAANTFSVIMSWASEVVIPPVTIRAILDVTTPFASMASRAKEKQIMLPNSADHFTCLNLGTSEQATG